MRLRSAKEVGLSLARRASEFQSEISQGQMHFRPPRSRGRTLRPADDGRRGRLVRARWPAESSTETDRLVVGASRQCRDSIINIITTALAASHGDYTIGGRRRRRSPSLQKSSPRNYTIGRAGDERVDGEIARAEPWEVQRKSDRRT